MKVIITERVPRGFAAITYLGRIRVRPRYANDIYLINHEKIHLKQQNEMLWIFFYLWYGIEWVIRAMVYWSRSRAYESISLEREAYTHGDDLNYLSRRKRFAWLSFL